MLRQRGRAGRAALHSGSHARETRAMGKLRNGSFPVTSAVSAMNSKMSLSQRDRAHLWHPYTQMKVAPDPIGIVRGEGVWLYTEDGTRLLDGTSSWWVNIHGHSHPKLNRALESQAGKLEH